MPLNRLRLIVPIWSWNSHHETRPTKKAVYATTQVMPPPRLPSVLAGKEPTGSDSETSEEMDSEKCVAKRSINVCVKLKWYAEVRLWVCYALGDCTSFECQALAHLLYTKEGPTKAISIIA